CGAGVQAPRPAEQGGGGGAAGGGRGQSRNDPQAGRAAGVPPRLRRVRGVPRRGAGGRPEIMKLTRRAADQLADRIVARTVEAGVVRAAASAPDWAAFSEFRRRVEASLTVPETSITPLLARVLYGIAHVARPQRVLGIGTYAGNGIVWLLGPGFCADGTYRAREAAALDVDPEATDLIADNLARLGMGPPVRCLCLDGHRAAEALDAG